MRHRSVRALALCFAFFCLLSVFAVSQVTSRVTGLVKDSSGAVVPAAKVTLTNEGTNISWTTSTTSAGTYVFDGIQPGKYTIAIEKSGFRVFQATGNTLNIGEPLTVNAALQIGTSSERVEVVGGAALVETTTSGNFGTTIDNTLVTQLPIVGVRGRNPLDLVFLTPGVVAAGAQATGGGSHVHGSRDRAWNYTLDGIDSNETSAGGSQLSPTRFNPDSVAEFRVITGNATAEYGRNSGAQVTVVTKSGTNKFHGNGFWFYQTPSLTANPPQNNANVPPLKKGQFVQNIYGGSLGGPIVKNKTFFFANVQLLHALNSSTVTRTVYTDMLKKNGIFRYVTGGARNAPFGASGASIDASGNPIVPIATYNLATNDPAALGLDPLMGKFLGLAPSPNNFTVGDGLNTAGYTFNTPQLEQQVDLTFKVDHTINQSNSVFARYAGGHQNTIADTANAGQPAFPGLPNSVDTGRRPRNVAIGWRSSLGSTMTNEFLVGLNRFAFDFVTPLDQTDVSAPFVTNLVTNPLLTAAGNNRYLTTYQLVDNFTKVTGAHTLKAGINFRYAREVDHRGSIGSLNAFPQVTFATGSNPVDLTAYKVPASGAAGINSNDQSTLLSSINDLLGRIGQVQQGYVAQDDNTFKAPRTFNIIDTRWPEYDFYVQDSWKLRPNLTVDLGLRLEARMAPRLKSYPGLVPNVEFASGLNPTTSMKFVPGQFYNDDWNNLGPSAGFAWDPWGDGKMSVRANYRLAYDRINTFSFSSTVFQGMPGLTYQQIDSTSGQDVVSNGVLVTPGVRAKNWTIPAPTQTPLQLRTPPQYGVGSLTVADPNMRTPKVNMWGLSIEREISHNTVFSLTYNGRHGVGLYGGYNANQANINAGGFLNEFIKVQGGGESALFDQLFAADSRRNTGESGAAFARRNFATNFAQNNVAGLALSISQRTQGGVPLLVKDNLPATFFQPFSQYLGGFNVLSTGDYSIYHGLEAQIERHMANGFLYQLSWTWSKSQDVRSFDPTFTTVASGSSQSAAATAFDFHNPRLNYAPSDFDRTHVFQGYFVYELPFGKGKHFGSSWSGVVDHILGGWEIAGNAIYETGRPITFYAGSNTFSSTVQTPTSCTGACDPYVGDVFRNGTNFQQFYIDSSAFNATSKCRDINNGGGQLCIPAPGQFSNIGRNYFRQARFWNMNTTVSKNFRITEGQSLQARWEIQNVTNSENYDTFGSQSIQSTVFTRLNQASDGVLGSNSQRRMQLSLKYIF